MPEANVRAARAIPARAKGSRSSKRTSSAPLRSSFVATRRATSYLSALLPKGWQRVYTSCRAGSYFGLRIVGNHCHATPPRELVGAQRWRWLSVHVELEHAAAHSK